MATANGTLNGAAGVAVHEPTNGTTTNGVEHVIDESIAVKPNAINDVPRLLEEIASNGEALTREGAQNRRQLLEAARSLVYALETPRESIIRYCWSQVNTETFPFAFSARNGSIDHRIYPSEIANILCFLEHGICCY